MDLGLRKNRDLKSEPQASSLGLFLPTSLPLKQSHILQMLFTMFSRMHDEKTLQATTHLKTSDRKQSWNGQFIFTVKLRSNCPLKTVKRDLIVLFEFQA